jgi:peptidoglycan/xylan/chitin deacetylase (PgdA/CDA1 family)
MPTGRALLLVATAAALALTLRSLMGSPVPLWLSMGALGAYAGLITWGVLNPSLEMFADVVWHGPVVWRGPDGARGVALTFDDGPHPRFTRSVLDALDTAGARATFFVIGEKGERHPEVLAIGQTNPRIARIAAELGLTIVGWSVRGRDGVRTDADRVVKRIVPRLRDGAIVLLHDAAERDDHEPVAAIALPRILTAMRERGLEPVRLDTWIGLTASGDSRPTWVERREERDS